MEVIIDGFSKEKFTEVDQIQPAHNVPRTSSYGPIWSKHPGP